MHTPRRRFITRALFPMIGAGCAATSATRASAAESVVAEPGKSYRLFPIGRVEKKGETVRLRIFEEYADGLLGLDGWSHLNVFYWFDQNDIPQRRKMLRVHPRGDSKNPLTGVFACRSPVRPNLIALSVCKILSVEGNVVSVDSLDAFDATPLIDLKPFIPPDAPMRDVRVPNWAATGRPAGR